MKNLLIYILLVSTYQMLSSIIMKKEKNPFQTISRDESTIFLEKNFDGGRAFDTMQNAGQNPMTNYRVINPNKDIMSNTSASAIIYIIIGMLVLFITIGIFFACFQLKADLKEQKKKVMARD